MENTQSSPAKVLIVDDDADFRNLLAMSLKRRGFEVLLASNAAAALDFIKLNKVNIVISDINMPGKTGIDLLHEAKACCAELPVVLLVTGYSEMTTEEALEHGADALFSKPIDVRSLSETIAFALSESETVSSGKTPTANELIADLSSSRMQTSFPAKVKSLSKTGFFLEISSANFPDVNELFKLKIEDQLGQPVFEGNGVVRWVRVDSNGKKVDVGFDCTNSSNTELHSKAQQFLKAS